MNEKGEKVNDVFVIPKDQIPDHLRHDHPKGVGPIEKVLHELKYLCRATAASYELDVSLDGWIDIGEVLRVIRTFSHFENTTLNHLVAAYAQDNTESLQIAG